MLDSDREPVTHVVTHDEITRRVAQAVLAEMNEKNVYPPHASHFEIVAKRAGVHVSDVRDTLQYEFGAKHVYGKHITMTPTQTERLEAAVTPRPGDPDEHDQVVNNWDRPVIHITHNDYDGPHIVIEGDQNQVTVGHEVNGSQTIEHDRSLEPDPA